MGVMDFLGDLFAPSQFKFDKRVWSESHVHKLHDEMWIRNSGSSQLKSLKQVGRILSYGGVPNDAGIYIIREWRTDVYTYVGQTLKLGLRTRLKQHLTEQGSKGLNKGALYEIRWAVTSSRNLTGIAGKNISAYGENAEQVAEALAILFFRPLHNPGNDWKGNLAKALRDGRANAIMAEAERLGFLRGSKKSRENFYKNIMSFGGG